MIQLAVTLVDMHTMALPSNCKNSVVICTVGNDKQIDRQTDRHTINPLSREKFGVKCIIKHIVQREFLPINPIIIIIIICIKELYE